MLSSIKRKQAFDQVKAIHPDWTDYEIRYAIERLPEPHEWTFPEDSIERDIHLKLYEAKRIRYFAWLLAPGSRPMKIKQQPPKVSR